MGIPLGLLGAQLSIAGAILYQSHQSTEQSEGVGVPMIIVGVILGMVAVFQARSPK